MPRTVEMSFQGGERMARILRRMNSNLANARAVSIGFLADAKYPHAYKNRVDHRPSPYRSTTQIAQVAFWNEYGTSRTNRKGKVTATPPRPFFRTMIAENSPTWGDSMAYLARVHKYNAERILTNMGAGIQAQLQRSIVEWSEPPNAEFTVKVKGFNKPLIDEGIMQREVGYRVTR